jgi:hypothetical protein
VRTLLVISLHVLPIICITYIITIPYINMVNDNFAGTCARGREHLVRQDTREGSGARPAPLQQLTLVRTLSMKAA